MGVPADISIFDVVDGPVGFVDTRNNKRAGTKRLVPWHRQGRSSLGSPTDAPPVHILIGWAADRLVSLRPFGYDRNESNRPCPEL